MSGPAPINPDARHRAAQRRQWLIGALLLLIGLPLLASIGYNRWSWSQLAALTVLLTIGLLAYLLFDKNNRLRQLRRRLTRLESQQAKHDSAEQMAALGLWALDLRHKRLHWSKGAYRIFGRAPSEKEPAFEAFLQAIHPDDLRRWRDVHERCVESDKPAKLEFRFRTGPNRELWLRSVAQLVRDRQDNPLRIEGTVQDVSGIRALQRQIAASEAKFRDLTHMSSDWVWETDAQHRLSFLSDSADTMLGPWARNMIGRRRWDGVEADPLPTEWVRMRARLDAQQPFENFEYTRLDNQRNAHHLSISGRPIFDDKNRFIGYRGTGQNITREKRQRILLEIDADMAAIMREHTDPKQVITRIIEAVCRRMGWLGGVRLTRRQHQCRAQEHAGSIAFTRMVQDLPDAMPTSDISQEGRVWRTGESLWLVDLDKEIDFARRYRTNELAAESALIAPITNEEGEVLNLLLFLGPVAYRGTEFLGQVAAVLSRTLGLYLQRTEADLRLRHASLHDALTGLPNRNHVNQTLQEMLAENRSLALLYIDLDRYKIINDTLGHSAGDRALVEIARRLRSAIAEDDLVGRMGGDEFIAIVSSTSKDAAAALGRKLLHAIEQPLVLANRAYFLSASIGVAMAPQDSTDASMLIKAADAAMYQVKSEGRNDLRFFAGDLQSPAHMQRLQLAAELPIAMQRGEVELFYQPVLDVRTRQVENIEALIRWRHPRLGLLLPERFMAAAEQSNLMREIDFWVVRRAIKDRIQLGLERYDSLGVSVNVSVRQLAEPDFLETLYSQMHEQDFPLRLLQLELTETSFIENPERTVELITQLRRLGVKVVIDNFGTGYSSLAHIKNLPVDGLKIDSAFVRNLPHDRGNAAIVQAITTLAAKLGMQAMAEGIETAAEMRALRELQCEVIQGELISGALPFAELALFLESLPGVRKMHLVTGTDHGAG